MAKRSPLPAVHVCAGSDCRKARKANRKLAELLDGRARVEVVGCQKVCDGPVIGLEVDGQLQWFDDVRGDAREALEAWLTRGKLKKPLRSRRIKKRAGKLRKG